jgi:hypothetical protein
MLRDPAFVILLLACACAYVWSKRGRKQRDPFPTELFIRDPIPSREGRFVLGIHLPDVGPRQEQFVFDPWEGKGEQHLAMFGTTGSGKTLAARLLAVTAKENWDWRVIAADGAKGGIDFTFMEDSNLGLVVTKGAIPTMLAEQAKEIERRAALLDTIRVGRVDEETGIEYADAPSSLRDLKPDERERYGLKPTLVIIDELAILLAEEKGRKGEPISGPLRKIAATGRFAGIHLVCIMQRGDADLLDGFIGNLLRARMLIGSTDQTAESMAHGSSSMAVWAEMMGAAGYEPNGMERALRPAGRAFVSGLSSHAPGLVQLYRFKSLNRHMTMTAWRAKQAALASVEPTPPSPDSAP